MSTSIGHALVIAAASLLAGEALVSAGTGDRSDRTGSAGEEKPKSGNDSSRNGGSDAGEPPKLELPPRPDDAHGGRAVLEDLDDANLDELEKAVLAEVRAGNVPDSLRRLTPVDLPTTPGAPARVWVTTDYLSIGSDDDFVRVPLRAEAAERLADELDAILPTKTIVDAIVSQAELRLPPRSVVPEPAVMWREESLAHDATIKGLARRFGYEPGQLVAGHMKDVVISPTLALHPDKLAIYGLHGLDGVAVQPLSVLHIEDYVDYSHGIRLVARKAEIDGAPVDLADVLADDERCTTFSPEGPIDLPAYR
jgi:hypothetical protein